jgi:hypothetical protein
VPTEDSSGMHPSGTESYSLSSRGRFLSMWVVFVRVELCLSNGNVASITETNRIHVVLFGM